MRDLASRLRDIVRRPTGAGSEPPFTSPSSSSPARVPVTGARELTYVPEPDPRSPAADVAAYLGGVPVGETSTCVAIDRVYAGDRSHGRRRVETFAPSAEWPIELFDRHLSRHAGWWRRVVFFDTETTGLAGGAGTLAFLAGCGWFEVDGSFRVRQFFLTSPAGERAMLDALASIFMDASLLVTYNGRSFDVPLMEMRWAFHRASAPTDDLPHFDMLPPARRLWRHREDAGEDGCRLSALERDVLGFHRLDDVPGFEIPTRYFHFLRTGDAAAIEGVLDHNRHDLVSLAGVMAYALWLAQEGPDACREGGERLGLGMLYERTGDAARAERAFELAATSNAGDVETRRFAYARLAELRRRSGRHDDAARAWMQVLALGRGRGWPRSGLDRRAAEALAIHHEHRAKDIAAARHYAQVLASHTSGRLRQEVDHRLKRIDRKLAGGLTQPKLQS